MLHCLKRSSIGHPQTGRAVTMVHCVSCQGLDRFRKLGECWLLEVLTSDDNCSIMREHLNDIVRCDVSFLQHLIQGFSPVLASDSVSLQCECWVWRLNTSCGWHNSCSGAVIFLASNLSMLQWHAVTLLSLWPSISRSEPILKYWGLKFVKSHAWHICPDNAWI